MKLQRRRGEVSGSRQSLLRVLPDCETGNCATMLAPGGGTSPFRLRLLLPPRYIDELVVEILVCALDEIIEREDSELSSVWTRLPAYPPRDGCWQLLSSCTIGNRGRNSPRGKKLKISEMEARRNRELRRKGARAKGCLALYLSTSSFASQLGNLLTYKAQRGANYACCEESSLPLGIF